MVGQNRWLANLDMYRKVPVDLMEGSYEGRAVSWIALIVMATLFFSETRQFLTPKNVTDIFLDTSKVSQVRVDFNITLMDLRCDFATINVVSFLGTEQNITKDIERFHIDGEGVNQQVNKHGYSLKHDVILHDPSVTRTIEELHENGKDCVSLDAESLEYAIEDHEFVFVKFFANWCSHCRALAPTWERFAEIMHDVEDKAERHLSEEKMKQHLAEDYTEEEFAAAMKLHLPVLIGEVDCVDHRDLCISEDIKGYPTMVLYVNGERYKDGEYSGDRTIASFIQFLLLAEEKTEKEEPDKIKKHAEEAIVKHLNMTQAHADWLKAMNRSLAFHNLDWDSSEHPGCRLVGSLHMNRAPGHFFLQAQSQNHDLDPHIANLSHVVHHLSFHPVDKTRRESVPDFLPSHYAQSVAPLDGHAFVVHEIHQSWHHYLKLVSTNSDRYQVLRSSQVSLYRDDHVPEAKFVLDVSPIAVKWSREYQPWYSYITSLMAILGGTFTVVGMFEYFVTSTSRQIRSATRRPRPRPPQSANVNGGHRAAP
ncbi:hypothetical protein ACA910_001389 [Epithemia clementina (nom. ined.)]